MEGLKEDDMRVLNMATELWYGPLAAGRTCPTGPQPSSRMIQETDLPPFPYVYAMSAADFPPPRTVMLRTDWSSWKADFPNPFWCSIFPLNLEASRRFGKRGSDVMPEAMISLTAWRGVCIFSHVTVHVFEILATLATLWPRTTLCRRLCPLKEWLSRYFSRYLEM